MINANSNHRDALRELSLDEIDYVSGAGVSASTLLGIGSGLAAITGAGLALAGGAAIAGPAIAAAGLIAAGLGVGAGLARLAE